MLFFIDGELLESVDCQLSSKRIPNIRGITTDRLFLIDSLTIGHINNGKRILNIFSVNSTNFQLTLIHSKHFYWMVPFDGCSLSSNDMFIVFPDQHKIVKYRIHQHGSKKNLNIKEINSIEVMNVSPSAISCSEGKDYINKLRPYIP